VTRSPERPVRRIRTVVGEVGISRELMWRALAELGLRRLWVVVEPTSRRTEALPPDLRARELLPTDVGAYRAARPDTPTAEVERRLAAGSSCDILCRGSDILAGAWTSTRIADVTYLGLELTLPDGVVHTFDAFTVPSERRRRRLRLLGQIVLERALEAGHSTLLYTVHPENRGMIAFLPPAARPLGKLTSVQIGACHATAASAPVRALVGRPRSSRHTCRQVPRAR
jgi:hypothetical protein